MIAADLSFDMHVSNVCKTCFFWLCQLRCVCRSSDVESVKTLVHAFVVLRFDYCNLVFASVPKSHRQVAVCSECCSTFDHQNSEVQTSSGYGTGNCSSDGAVQTHHNSPSLSSAPGSNISHQLPCACVLSSWSPVPINRQTSSTVCLM